MPLTHRPFSRSTWYLLAVIVVAQFGMVIGGILYTNYIATQNAQKWCHLLVTLDEGYNATPPRTDTGRRVAADIHRLRTELRCTGQLTER